MRITSFTAAAVLLCASPTLFAQATWTTLGSGSAADMSDDGQFVSGNDGGSTFLWSATGGQVSLGQDGGVAVSSDGTTVFGDMTNLSGDSVAGRWQMSTGWVELPGLGGQSGSSVSSAYGMSGDGSVCAGLGWINAGTAGAFRWDSVGGTTALPQTGPNSSRANGVSEDGTHIGGWDEIASGPRRAAFWDGALAQTFPTITATNPDGLGEVWGFSANNNFVVGVTDGQGFIWDATNGMTKTGTLPSGDPFQIGEARAVSNDGQKAVGWYRVAFPFDNRATIWTPGAGIQELKAYLEANGATGVPNLTFAAAISADGTKILANALGVWGIADLGDFAASYCACDTTAPCGNTTSGGEGCQNSAGSGALVAAAGGASVSADNLTFDAIQLPPNRPSLLFAGLNQLNGGAGNLFGDGLLCVGGGIQRLGVVFSDGTGNASFGPGLIGPAGWMSGDVRNFQVWYRDPAGPCGAGFNTSNALEVTFTL